MMTIEWNDNLKTGIAIIDEQHKELFDSINRLDGLKDTTVGFKQLLIELQTYISQHFKTEEEYMKYTEYPKFEEHKASHDEFFEYYKNIIKKYSSSGFVLDMEPEMVAYVETWLTEHYTNADVQMAAHILKCRSCEN